MRSALARFLLAVSGSSLRTAVGLLQKSKRFRQVEPGDQLSLTAQSGQVDEPARAMMRIIRRVQGGGAADLPLTGFTYLPQAAAQPKVIVFDLVDGSHCYYIDPPGVCCCGAC